jgi:hypothetical protein
MDKTVHDFIESGILEAYVTGGTSERENEEVVYMKQHYPAVQKELKAIESSLELLARHMAIPPPPQLWDRIEDEISGLIVTDRHKPAEHDRDHQYNRQQTTKPEPDYIEVEGQSSHMRIHKTWKWVFAAVFVLGKIFLGFAIYFYLENRQAQQNILELKQQLREMKVHRP